MITVIDNGYCYFGEDAGDKNGKVPIAEVVICIHILLSTIVVNVTT